MNLSKIIEYVNKGKETLNDYVKEIKHYEIENTVYAMGACLLDTLKYCTSVVICDTEKYDGITKLSEYRIKKKEISKKRDKYSNDLGKNLSKLNSLFKNYNSIIKKTNSELYNEMKYYNLPAKLSNNELLTLEVEIKDNLTKSEEYYNTSGTLMNLDDYETGIGYYINYVIKIANTAINMNKLMTNKIITSARDNNKEYKKTQTALINMLKLKPVPSQLIREEKILNKTYIII
jgi:hypothetical protein